MTDIFAHRAHHPKDTQEHANLQIVILSLIVALTWSFEYMMVSEADARVQAIQSDRTAALVNRLLSAMCDCIVHLDSDLRIAEPCPKLASLLLRKSSASSMLAQ